MGSLFAKIRYVYLFAVMALLLSSSTLSAMDLTTIELNTTESFSLNRDGNIEYGAINSSYYVANHLIKTDYATDLVYFREGRASKTASLNNNSQLVMTNTEIYTSPYFEWSRDETEPSWKPIYVVAYNKTDYAPNINFTLGVEKMGYLELNKRTAFTLDSKYIYVFKIDFENSKILYDLNARSTAVVYCLLVDAKTNVTVNSFNIYDDNRKPQPIYSPKGNAILVYLYSDFDTSIIIEPRTLNIKEVSYDEAISGTFYNPPDMIWNETLHNWQSNEKRDTLHAFYVELPAGTYLVRYDVFNNSVNSELTLITNESFCTDTLFEGYNVLTISSQRRQTVYHAVKPTRIIILLSGDPGTEFDYVITFRHADVPIFSQGDNPYNEEVLAFFLNITSPEVVLITHNFPVSIDGRFYRYTSGTSKTYYFYYTLREDPNMALKLLLVPGLYLFVSNQFSSYDTTIKIVEIKPKEFDENYTIQLHQTDYSAESYVLLKIDLGSDIFNAFNLTLSTQGNYTVEVLYTYYASVHKDAIGGNKIDLGNQQQNGNYVAYGTNNTEIINMFSPENKTTRYLLLYVYKIYNNTECSLPDLGNEITEPTLVTLNLIKTNETPDGLKNMNYVEAKLTTDKQGKAIYSVSLNDTTTTFLALKVNVPDLRWYDIDATIVNGLIDYTFYFLDAKDEAFVGYVYGYVLWNKYYSVYYFSDNFNHYNDTDISNVKWHTEFGVLDNSVLLFLVIDPVNTDCTVEITFTPHQCSVISPLNLGVFPKPPSQTVNLTTIGIAAGGVVIFTILTSVVVRLFGRKKR
ncbi:MAG: hypothetical protein ACTSYD_05130 [Candidatus Heimdallarchaeaceae archaeon]